MTLKTRRFLFLVLAFSFLIVGATLVLYSAGIRIDWKTLGFVETGGIYIESDPTNVQIKINGRALKNGAGLLQTGAFINNLLQGPYKIVVSQNGYLDWQKETDVLPQAVSVFNKIVLVPVRAPEKISAPPPDFYAKNNWLVLKNDNGLTYGDKKVLGSEVVKLRDSGSVITRSVTTGNYYLSSLSDLNSSLNLSLTFNNLKESKLGFPGAVRISKIEPYEYNERKFIVKTESTLYGLDVEKLTLEQIATGVKDFTLAKSDLFWIDGKNRLFDYNLSLRNKENILTLPITSPIIKFEASPSQDALGILEDNNTLTLFDKKRMQRKLLGYARDFSFSYNSEFLAFTKGDGGIGIYRLETDKYIEMKPIPGVAFRNPAWYRDDAHVFLQDENGNLFFMEVDDRTPQNIYPIGREVRKYIYDKSDNQIYFSNPSGLFKTEI